MAAVTDDHRFEAVQNETMEGEKHTMCEVLDRLIAEGEARGEARGISIGEARGEARGEANAARRYESEIARLKAELAKYQKQGAMAN